MTPHTNSPWFLGIDLGTGSCKSIVVDSEARILGLGSSAYAGEEEPDEWQEQDPQALLSGLITAVQRAVTAADVQPQNCAGLSVGSAMHSLMALDSAGNPLTGVITWTDGRGARQAAAVRESAEAAQLYQTTGCPIHGMYPLYKIIWLREERPELFQRAAHFISAKEYVVAQLIGEYAVDYCMASGTGLLNIHTREWHEPALKMADISVAQLSPLASPFQTFPTLQPHMAERLGLRATTPLVLGSTDAADSSLGAGAVEPWQATCMIGTSGAYRVIAQQPVLDQEGRIWCYAIDDGHWLAGGAANNGGIALAWLLDVVGDYFQERKVSSFDTLLQEAQAVGAGADGLLCLPLFAGERSPHWNVNARALFFGLTLNHGLGHLARALLEGVGFHFRSLVDLLASAGVQPRELRVSGGFTRSDFWVQLMSDILQRELLMPASGETSALGAALWAMHASGNVSSLQEMGAFVPSAREFHPRTTDAATYEELYALYQDLYQRVAPKFNAIVALQDRLREGRERGKEGGL